MITAYYVSTDINQLELLKGFTLFEKDEDTLVYTREDTTKDFDYECIDKVCYEYSKELLLPLIEENIIVKLEIEIDEE